VDLMNQNWFSLVKTRGWGILVLYAAWKLLRKRTPKNLYVYDPSKVPSKLEILGKDVKVTLDEIPQMCKEIRASYESGYSKPYETRLGQLKALRRLLQENEKAIIAALKADLGRPHTEALVYDLYTPLNELDHCIHSLADWMQPETKGFNLLTFPGKAEIHKEPLGVVLVIGTWNFPIMLNLVPLIGALCGGNCVVVKPCNVAPATAQLLCTLLKRYMDPLIVTVLGPDIEGDRHTTAALLEHKFDHVFFTGSPSVGRVVMEKAARYLTPCTLELGGKNPVFVDRDANLDLAAQRTVWGRMLNAGQQCIAPDYVLCHQAVLRPFLAKCAEYTRSMYGADPKDSVGRIVGDRQMSRLVQVLTTHRGHVLSLSLYLSPSPSLSFRSLPLPLPLPLSSRGGGGSGGGGG